MIKPFPFHGANALLKPHLQKVLDGEYSILGMSNPQGSPLFLDLGANIGSYAYWALKTFPRGKVVSVEANKANVGFYKKNMKASGFKSDQYEVIHRAVSVFPEKTVKLYHSTLNTGMHSVHKALTNTKKPKYSTVKTVHPSKLPNCTFLKVDIEGYEPEVIKAYLESHTVAPAVISAEFHIRFDYFTLDELLSEYYIPASGHIIHPDLGTINYIHRSIAPAIVGDAFNE